MVTKNTQFATKEDLKKLKIEINEVTDARVYELKDQLAELRERLIDIEEKAERDKAEIIKKLKKHIQKKQDEFEVRLFNNMRHYIDARFEAFEQKIEEKINQKMIAMEDRIMTKIDNFLALMQETRQEATMLSAGYIRLEDLGMNHEARIARLEQSLQRSLN